MTSPIVTIYVSKCSAKKTTRTGLENSVIAIKNKMTQTFRSAEEGMLFFCTAKQSSLFRGLKVRSKL